MGKLTAYLQYFWDLCLVIVRFWWDLIWWHVGYLALCQAPWNLCPGNLSPQFHQRSELDCVIVSWYIKCVLRIFHHNFITGQSLFLCQYCDMWIGVLNRWKYDGPSLSFLALVDMAVVHSSCRLCIHLATRIHSKEEASVAPQRPCQCSHRSGTIHHLYVRERGHFKPESIFLE
jgi:hypothetical protein